MIKNLPEQIPQQLTHPKFIARKLSASDVEKDFAAVMSNIDFIRKTRGGNWPTEDMTLEENRIDLSWHQREFEYENSFAYTVMSPDESECLGCFYLYPPNFRTPAPAGTDVDISFWVTEKADRELSLYKELYRAIKKWTETEWSFEKPYWSNTIIPE